MGQDLPTNLPFTPSSGFRSQGQMNQYGVPINPNRPNSMSQLNPIDREQFKDQTTGEVYGWGDLQTQVQNPEQQNQGVPPQQPQQPQQAAVDEFDDLIDDDPYQAPQGQVMGAQSMRGGMSVEPGSMSRMPVQGRTGGQGQRSAAARPAPAGQAASPYMARNPLDKQSGAVLGAYQQGADNYFKNADKYINDLDVSINTIKDPTKVDPKYDGAITQPAFDEVKERMLRLQESRGGDDSVSNRISPTPQANPTLSPAPKAGNIFDSLNPIKPVYGAEYGEEIPANNPLEYDFNLPKAGEGVKMLQDTLQSGANTAGNIFRKKLEEVQPFRRIGEAGNTMTEGIDSLGKTVKNKVTGVAKAVEGGKSNVFNAINNVKNAVSGGTSTQSRQSSGSSQSNNSQPSRSQPSTSVSSAQNRAPTQSGGKVTVSTQSARPAPAGQAVASASKPQTQAAKPAPKPVPAPAQPKPNVFNQLISWLFKR